MGKILGYYVMPHPPVLVPEIGKGENEKLEKTADACAKVAEEISRLKPATIIVITPHGPVFSDAVALSFVPQIYGDFRKFGVPQYKMSNNINMHLTSSIIKHCDNERIQTVQITDKSVKDFNVLCEIDHGAAVPLYFVNKAYTDYELVHITYGMLSKLELYRFGSCIKKAVEDDDSDAVIIASGDLSHKLSSQGPYSYHPSGPVFDKTIIELLTKGDVEEVFNMDKELVKSAGECGLRSCYILTGAMDGYEFKGDLLSYEGPFGVGYGVLKLNTVKETEKDVYHHLLNSYKTNVQNLRKNENPYVRLARETLEHYIKEKELIDIPRYATNEMKRLKRGVFVSLKKDGELRGCIGTIFPLTDCIGHEIIRNSVEAGFDDPRFSPVNEEELNDIVYSVDVLATPEATTKDQLDPKKYGIILKSGARTGVLLPNLEGVDTIDEQISITLRKANIDSNENYSIERFEVERYR